MGKKETTTSKLIRAEFQVYPTHFMPGNLIVPFDTPQNSAKKTTLGAGFAFLSMGDQPPSLPPCLCPS
jgi:hypothetical protein